LEDDFGESALDIMERHVGDQNALLSDGNAG
jgi:hypothetical protein